MGDYYKEQFYVMSDRNKSILWRNKERVFPVKFNVSVVIIYRMFSSS